MGGGDRGVVADYALVGETSGFGIVQAECGAAWFKVRVTGREVYTPRFERGRSIQENPNAFAKAAHVIMAIEEWAVGYEKRETMEFAGGTIIPKAQIIQVRGAKGSDARVRFGPVYGCENCSGQESNCGKAGDHRRGQQTQH